MPAHARNLCTGNQIKSRRRAKYIEAGYESWPVGVNAGYTPTGPASRDQSAFLTTPPPRHFSQTSTYIDRCYVFDFNTTRVSSFGKKESGFQNSFLKVVLFQSTKQQHTKEKDENYGIHLVYSKRITTFALLPHFVYLRRFFSDRTTVPTSSPFLVYFSTFFVPHPHAQPAQSGDCR